MLNVAAAATVREKVGLFACHSETEALLLFSTVRKRPLLETRLPHWAELRSKKVGGNFTLPSFAAVNDTKLGGLDEEQSKLDVCFGRAGLHWPTAHKKITIKV